MSQQVRSDPRRFPFNDPIALDVDPDVGEVRRSGALAWVTMAYGEPAWLATRYDDVRLVLSDPRFSRAAAVGKDEPRSRAQKPRAAGIKSLDPPEHSRLRRLVSKAFTPRTIEQLRPYIQEVAGDLLDRMIAAGPPGDVAEDFGLLLPIRVICQLLGVPVEDREDFHLWSDAFLSTTRFSSDEIAGHMASLRGYMSSLIEQRRLAPQDDLLSALVLARDDDDRLSEEEMLSLAEALLIAGHETTASQIPNFIYVLLQHPDQLELLRAEPELLPGAIEELLRYVPLGAAVSARYALEDVELGGVVVGAGEPVVCDLAAAQRDEDAFTEPDRLDLRRKEASTIAFGHGPHYCLGAALGRAELQIALGTLLDRMPNLNFMGAAEDTEWKTGVATRGPRYLQVCWDAI